MSHHHQHSGALFPLTVAWCPAGEQRASCFRPFTLGFLHLIPSLCDAQRSSQIGERASTEWSVSLLWLTELTWSSRSPFRALLWGFGLTIQTKKSYRRNKDFTNTNLTLPPPSSPYPVPQEQNYKFFVMQGQRWELFVISLWCLGTQNQIVFNSLFITPTPQPSSHNLISKHLS